MQSKSKKLKNDDDRENKNSSLSTAATSSLLNEDVLAILKYREKYGFNRGKLDLFNQYV